MPEMTDAQAAACWKKLRGKIINVFASMGDDDELSCEWLLDEIYGLEFEQLHPAEPQQERRCETCGNWFCEDHGSDRSCDDWVSEREKDPEHDLSINRDTE